MTSRDDIVDSDCFGACSVLLVQPVNMHMYLSTSAVIINRRFSELFGVKWRLVSPCDFLVD